MARKNYITDKVKRMRDNEDTLSRDNKISHGELSEVLYAIIRRLNYLYDISVDEDRKEAILDKKARLMIQLILLEEK